MVYEPYVYLELVYKSAFIRLVHCLWRVSNHLTDNATFLHLTGRLLILATKQTVVI